MCLFYAARNRNFRVDNRCMLRKEGSASGTSQDALRALLTGVIVLEKSRSMFYCVGFIPT